MRQHCTYHPLLGSTPNFRVHSLIDLPGEASIIKILEETLEKIQASIAKIP